MVNNSSKNYTKCKETAQVMGEDKLALGGALYTQKGPPTLDEMTGPEIEAALQRTDTLLLPVGATEAHGAHLPLGTDSFEARENCRRAALRLAEMGCPVVIGPVIPFGVSSFHLDFAGTINLSAQTMISLLREICLSLHASGFRKFALVHGHDGNLPVMMVAAQEVVDQTSDAQALVLNWLQPLSRVYQPYPDIAKAGGAWRRGGDGAHPGHASRADASGALGQASCPARGHAQDPGARAYQDRRRRLSMPRGVTKRIPRMGILAIRLWPRARRATKVTPSSPPGWPG